MKYKENQEFPLRTEFLDQLRSHSGSDISEIYRHLFTSMESGSLESTLMEIKEDIKNENWFYRFHKSIRQTDFFGSHYVGYSVDLTNEEEKQRIDDLGKEIPRELRLYGTKEEIESSGLEEQFAEYKRIRRKSNVERRRSISGNLDMALWNLIHLDKENFIMNFFEKFFMGLRIKESKHPNEIV